MSDSLLSDTDREEALSKAYAQAIAAGAGYVTGEMDFDRDGVDIQFNAGGSFRPKIDVQLKACVNLSRQEGEIKYPLKVRNYELLRVRTQTPRILVLLDLPKDSQDWLSVDINQLVIRNCAYWASLVGEPETNNKNTITISINEGNVFNVDALKELMVLSRSGEL